MKFLKNIPDSIRRRPLNLVLILCVAAAYLLNNYVLKRFSSGSIQMFFTCYFNDLICPVLFLAYLNMLLLSVGRELTDFFATVITMLGVGCIWEFVAPYLKPSSTADWMDIVCYVVGGIAYWAILLLAKKTAFRK